MCMQVLYVHKYYTIWAMHYIYLLMVIKDTEVEVALTYPYKQHSTTKLSKCNVHCIVANYITIISSVMIA